MLVNACIYNLVDRLIHRTASHSAFSRRMPKRKRDEDCFADAGVPLPKRVPHLDLDALVLNKRLPVKFVRRARLLGVVPGARPLCAQEQCALLQTPLEVLVESVLCHLGPGDLARLYGTCRLAAVTVASDAARWRAARAMAISFKADFADAPRNAPTRYSLAWWGEDEDARSAYMDLVVGTNFTPADAAAELQADDMCLARGCRIVAPGSGAVEDFVDMAMMGLPDRCVWTFGAAVGVGSSVDAALAPLGLRTAPAEGVPRTTTASSAAELQRLEEKDPLAVACVGAAHNLGKMFVELRPAPPSRARYEGEVSFTDADFYEREAWYGAFERAREEGQSALRAFDSEVAASHEACALAHDVRTAPFAGFFFYKTPSNERSRKLASALRRRAAASQGVWVVPTTEEAETSFLYDTKVEGKYVGSCTFEPAERCWGQRVYAKALLPVRAECVRRLWSNSEMVFVDEAR